VIHPAELRDDGAEEAVILMARVAILGAKQLISPVT
jgi:hypothetical protein